MEVTTDRDIESTELELAVVRDGNDQEHEVDLPYGSAKRSLEYTSENFKLEIENLPFKADYHQVKQMLEQKMKINPRKIRMGRGKAFIAFRTHDERDDAMSKIENFEFKGRSLRAKVASARHDPFVKRSKSDDTSIPDRTDTESAKPPTSDEINAQVCPMWDKSYEHQLKYKSTTLRAILKLGKQLTKLCPTLERDHPALHQWTQNNAKICCPFDGVVASPITVGYRNKCEFNVGSDGTIGFKAGRYKDGSEGVYQVPDNCPIVSKTMFDIIDRLQAYLKDPTRTKLKGYSNITHEGHVRQITVRTNKLNEVLVIFDMNPQDLEKSDLKREMDAIVDVLTENIKVVSIFFNISDRNHMSNSQETLKLVYGIDHLTEILEVAPEAPLKLRIGPTSFFQVNTEAAESLYRTIDQVAQLDSKSLVLDVGCGTGTIGLSLARKVSHVIGIEIVESAVADAKLNAKENNITNVTFLAGRAEDLIQESITILRAKLAEQGNEGEIVAIVDPPRTGFNNSFIKTLRASNIKKIIYIACDPKANTNLVTLLRPPSKAYQGKPFIPVRAKGFDLFPHTKFCELLIVYERLSDTSSDASTDCKVPCSTAAT